ncbi:uncharacterized protein LOC131673508 isoform X2 [Phymastichus coffea]|nr:uncharacterized protein LOC131673508 isoform X2 [Phymastichus coffea]XP_058807525.1 uncharacterized protein LOC131673508 isoform X2 [Phymastichus coffea]
MLICGSHFTKDDYQAVADLGLRHLKLSAVPNKNLLINFDENIMIESNKQTNPSLNQSLNRRKCSLSQCNVPPNEKTSYHFFPKKEHIRQQWVQACGVRVSVQPYACICSAHFERTDFITGPNSKQQILKLDAVPKLNLPKHSIVKSQPQKPKTINESKLDDKITTIIYVPENCSHGIINTSGIDLSNSKIVISKSDDLHLFNENVFCEVQDSISVKSIDDTATQNERSLEEEVTILEETVIKPSLSKKLKQGYNRNTKNVQKKFIISKEDNIYKIVNPGNSNNNVLNQTNNVELKKKVKTSSIKKSVIRPGVSAVTLCTDCGQYCKIEDEDLLYKSYKNLETLAAELLLELQKTTLSHEDEYILLTKKGIDICNKAIEKQTINLMEMLTNDYELMAFTGINFKLLNKLTELVSEVEANSSRKYNIPAKNRIVICLCKLRINLSFACLGMLFGMSQQLCASSFFAMLRTLSHLLEKTIYWPKTEELIKNLPECFQSFKQTRVILNCSETQVEKQRCFNCQQKLMEDSVKDEAIKLVLGIAPSGLIIFKSNIFYSQSSSVSVFTQTNIMDKFDPLREAIMADKTLNIEAECAEHNITLIKLPKLGKKKQFSKQEVELIKNISTARIHVDRTLHRFKMYKIMQTKVHWRILPYLDEVCTVIAGIVNLKNPIPPNEIDIKSVGPIHI